MNEKNTPVLAVRNLPSWCVFYKPEFRNNLEMITLHKNVKKCKK